MSAYSKNSGFFNGKGFYLALALCLAGAGTAAYFAAPKDAPLEQESSVVSAAESRSETVRKTEKSVDDVEKEKTVSVREELSSLQEEIKATAESVSSVPQVKQQTYEIVMPVDGEVFAHFSDGELVRNETMGDWRTHNGIDIRADEGAKVVSAASGAVVGIEDDPLWGTVVTIDHGSGLVSVYRGLASTLSVKVNDEVSAGEAIGNIGQIPSESLLPAHLHFEMTKNGNYIDPVQMIESN